MPKRGLTLPVLHFQDGGITPDPAAIAAAQQTAGQFWSTGGAPPAQAAPQFSLPSEQGMPVGTGALTGTIQTLRQPPARRATLVAPPAPGPAIPGRQQPYGLGEQGMPIGTGALLGTGLMSGQPPLAKGALVKGTSGLASTFADPGDIARYKAAKAAGKSEEQALMVGDNGVGNAALGGIDTTKSYGIAMPENWLRQQYGNDKSAWRRARAVLTINGQTIQVPYIDTGPGQGPQSKGVVTDLSYSLAKALGSTGMVKATVQPGGKGGADYLDDPDAWQEEQNQIARQLIPQQGQLAGIGMQAGGPVLPLNKTPEEAKPPSMAPGLGTVGGAPSSKPTGEEPPPEQKAATPPPSFNPREAGAKPVENKPSFDPRDAGAKPIEQQAAPKTTFDPRAAGAKPVEQPAKPEEEKPAQPPQVQQPPQTPPAQDHPIAQDQPSTEDQIAAMVKQGVSPGAAQAIVKGQPPTTISGEKPAGPKLKQQQEQPQQQKQPWAPTGALTADSKNRVDPVALYRYLLGKFSKSSVLNHPPADGADWGIKTGSAAEWAAFGLAIAKQESDLDARSTNLEDPGGSYGLFQFSQTGQPKYTNGEDQYDPQKSADAFVRSVEQLVGGKGSIAHMGVTFGSILRPHEAGQYLEGAQKVAAGGSGADLVSSGGGGDGKGTRAPEGPGGPGGPGELAFIPVIPSHGPTASEHLTAQSALPGPSGGGGT